MSVAKALMIVNKSVQTHRDLISVTVTLAMNY